MESKSDKQFVEPLLTTLRKFQNNNRCLYPGCLKKPIGSHIIAESVLEQLAENEGKVLTWDVSDNDIVVNTLHYAHFFPAMAQVDRSPFVRQAANLWAVKERLWCLIRDRLLLYDSTVTIVDSMPIPVCQFARAYRCHRFDDTASFGKDHTCRQTFYGFRLHMMRLLHSNWIGWWLK